MHHRRFLACAALLLALAPSIAAAQRGTLDVYQPSPTPIDDFALSRPNDMGHLRFGAQLQLDYALNPLVWENRLGDGSSERFSIVEHQLVGTLGLSLGLFDRVIVYAGLPVTFAMTGTDAAAVRGVGGVPADGTGLSDAYVGARARLFGEASDPFALGLQATLTLPTSIDGAYRGESTVSFRPTLTGEIRPGAGVHITLNAGALVRQEDFHTTDNVFFSHELRLGAGVSIPLWTDADPRTHLDLLAQIQAGTAFRDFFGRASSTSEATGGLRLMHASGLVIGAVAGPGITRGFGSPDLRAVLTVGWATPETLAAPPPPDPCADTPEDPDGWQDDDGCADPDNDGDGILDVNDACPNEPENLNDYQDADGCPDEIPDTDGDGLRDDVDQCPTQPEDVDQFEDENGCPDPDNDADGVIDTADQCPVEAGPVENHGCPDRDRDVDTVVDRRDNCPDVPGLPANYGCPEEQRQTVHIEDSQIAILDTVYFRTDSDVILSRSFAMLDNVAAVLVAHPEIEHIRVEGHTDSRGRREHNLDLSQRRAQSVVRYLVEHGHVDAARLEAIGFGPDRPVVEHARTPAQHAQNRRVVFSIVSDAVQTTSTGPSSETIDR
jgi:outer membrane protein OmpA-like peptidoglycan-associated protein